MLNRLLAPNFFMEVKGSDGLGSVAMRQIRYGGAVGSRGIHSLQTYGEDKLRYDGQAYTFNLTYHSGRLKLYAHHATTPKSKGGRPEYHITQVNAWGKDW